MATAPPRWLGRVTSVEWEADKLRAKCIAGTERYRLVLLKAGYIIEAMDTEIDDSGSPAEAA